MCVLQKHLPQLNVTWCSDSIRTASAFFLIFHFKCWRIFQQRKFELKLNHFFLPSMKVGPFSDLLLMCLLWYFSHIFKVESLTWRTTGSWSTTLAHLKRARTARNLFTCKSSACLQSVCYLRWCCLLIKRLVKVRRALKEAEYYTPRAALSFMWTHAHFTAF